MQFWAMVLLDRAVGLGGNDISVAASEAEFEAEVEFEAEAEAAEQNTADNDDDNRSAAGTAEKRQRDDRGLDSVERRITKLHAAGTWL